MKYVNILCENHAKYIKKQKKIKYNYKTEVIMAKSIKAIVRDRNTLIIDEPAETGDFIELDKISKLDTGFINELMESAYKNRLEKELNEKLNEKETYLNEKHQSNIELLKKDFEKNKSDEVKKIVEEKQK